MDRELSYTESKQSEQSPTPNSQNFTPLKSNNKTKQNKNKTEQNKQRKNPTRYCASTWVRKPASLKDCVVICANNWIWETVWHSSNKHSFALGRTRQNVLSDYQKGGSQGLVLGHAPVHVSKQKDEMCRDFRTSEADNHMVQEAGKTLVNRETKRTFLLPFWRQTHGVMPGKEGRFS